MDKIDQLLNNLDKTNDITNIFKQIPTIGGLTSAVIGLIIAIVVFKFLMSISKRIIKSIILAICVYCIIFGSGLKLTDIINLENREKAIIENIIDTANKQHLEIEITNTHLIYNGKAYKHHIPDIKKYIIKDENDKYIIIE